MSEGTPVRSPRSLRGAAGELGAALLGLTHTRLSLIALEFDEVRGRTVERLVIVLVAVLCLAFALLCASALVVVVFWETNRIAALCGVTLAYLVIGLVLLWRLSVRGKTEGPPFAETIAQFERDRVWLASKSGDGK